MEITKLMYKGVVDRFWGECSDEDADKLLWNATCFPFGSVKQVCRQLREMRKKTDSVDEAIGIACKEMDEQMAQCKRDDPEFFEY